MKSLKQVLQNKTKPMVSVGPNDTIQQALSLMAEHDIGALLVVEGERLIGILSERDYARKVALHGKSSKDTPVREVMTEKVFFVTPEQTVSQCLAIMTEKRFRHLPVLDSDQKVIGIISIGDLVKEKISEQSFIIDQLERYITDRLP